jgi:hypothetical protein
MVQESISVSAYPGTDTERVGKDGGMGEGIRTMTLISELRDLKFVENIRYVCKEQFSARVHFNVIQ